MEGCDGKLGEMRRVIASVFEGVSVTKAGVLFIVGLGSSGCQLIGLAGIAEGREPMRAGSMCLVDGTSDDVVEDATDADASSSADVESPVSPYSSVFSSIRHGCARTIGQNGKEIRTCGELPVIQ